MKKIAGIILMAVVLFFPVAAFGDEDSDIQVERLNMEDMYNKRSGDMILVEQTNSRDIKQIDIEDEALTYLKNNQLDLKVIVPEASYTLQYEDILTDEMLQAIGTREPVKVRIKVKEPSSDSVAEKFNSWYYSQQSWYRLYGLEYNMEAEILVGGKSFADIENFAAPIDWVFDYSQLNVPSTVNERGLMLLNWDEGSEAWEEAGGTADIANKNIIFSTTRLGLFAAVSSKEKTENIVYPDVSGRWSSTDIFYMANEGILHTSNGENFFPTETISRGEFAAYLVRVLGLSSYTGDKSFVDVSINHVYREEIMIAANNGLVAGVDGTHFAPEAKITREQMAVMMLRAINKTTLKVYMNDQVLNELKDKSEVSTWAQDGVTAMINTGLMSGRAENVFAPKGVTTREEAVVILKRLMDKIA